VQPFFRKVLDIFSDREKTQIGMMLMLMLLGAGLEALGVSLIPTFVALIANPALLVENHFLNWLISQLAQFGASSERAILFSISLILLAVYLFKNLYLSVLVIWQNYFLYQKQVELSSRLLQSYLARPYTFHLQHNSADLVRNISSELPRLFQNVLLPLLTIATETMAASCIAILLITIQPISSAIAVGFLSLCIFGINQITRRQLSAQGLIRQVQLGQMIQTVNQSLGGLKETKVLGREKFFVNQFLSSIGAFGKANLYILLSDQLPGLLIEAASIASVLLVVMFSLWQRQGINTILPMLALFAIAALRLMPSAKRILSALTNVRFFQHTIDVLHEDLAILNQNPDFQPINDIENSANTIQFHQKIELCNLDYTYPEADKPSVTGITLAIAKGQSVAFVGMSGAGKTTVIDLILGLLTPDRGKILVDDRDISTNLPSWQRQIGYIPQNIFLSDDSILRNIAFGVDEIDESQVWEALKAAQLAELIQSLPQKLDTLVGENGIRLSGGQRQRIGIARALYHQPQILIMDEATAALDNNTEREFMQALSWMSANKTLITIAHRLSTVKNCDYLYFFQDGQITAEGTYEQLLAKSLDFRLMASAIG
jgi:ATP-binding cassette, subfamily B, bacterial PglK